MKPTIVLFASGHQGAKEGTRLIPYTWGMASDANVAFDREFGDAVAAKAQRLGAKVDTAVRLQLADGKPAQPKHADGENGLVPVIVEDVLVSSPYERTIPVLDDDGKPVLDADKKPVARKELTLRMTLVVAE